MSEEVKRLPERSTRGKRWGRCTTHHDNTHRLSELIDEEEKQADEAFWGQDYFKEDEHDTEYQEEEEEEDIVDPDFDNPENEITEPLSPSEMQDTEEKEKVRVQRIPPFNHL